MGNRRTEAKREQATELREEAAQSTASVEASRREAEEAAARAEVARAEAARAEQDAAQAQQGVQVEEARVEDRVRTADDVDPDVDTRSEDYHPDAPTTTAPETGGGTTYADPADSDDRTATDVSGRPLDDPPPTPTRTRTTRSTPIGTSTAATADTAGRGGRASDRHETTGVS